MFGQVGFLHNVDGEVVDGNGDPILLRGFGLGGWLVPEGYMLINTGWINGYESPSDIENHVLLELICIPQNFVRKRFYCTSIHFLHTIPTN